jgi:hypothetical protein
MENATKALLIAAAVLIAILIISLTLVIYRQGANAVAGADLSETEAAKFNGKFTLYEGNRESTSQVNALLNTVCSHNKQQAAEGDTSLCVAVTVRYNGNVLVQLGNEGTEKSLERVKGNKYYKVKCKYDGRIITSIEVTTGVDVGSGGAS